MKAVAATLDLWAVVGARPPSTLEKGGGAGGSMEGLKLFEPLANGNGWWVSQFNASRWVLPHFAWGLGVHGEPSSVRLHAGYPTHHQSGSWLRCDEETKLRKLVYVYAVQEWTPSRTFSIACIVYIPVGGSDPS
jgi:hypothetical protein